MPSWTPLLEERSDGRVALGHLFVDDYLEFVFARSRRNTLLATAYDLKVFVTVVGKDPGDVESADVLRFVKEQRKVRPGRVVVPIDGGGLSLLSSLYGFLVARGDVPRTPVLRSISTRAQGRGHRGVPLVRAVRPLPRVLQPEQVNALMGSLRNWRDRAMVEAMVLGGLRRAEVWSATGGPAHRRSARVRGRGQRRSPAADADVGPLLRLGGALPRRRATSGHRHRPRLCGVEGAPPGRTADLASAKERAGLSHATCHELRHTCLTRLREAGMALEAVQAQAGHRSIESTRLYLHLANDGLAGEYHKAAELIDAATATGTSS